MTPPFDAPNVPVWDDAPTAPLPHLQGDIDADVCVVGLGGSGLSAIHELLARGVKVVGLDAGRVAGGAAGRNGGFLLAGLHAPHHRAVERLGREGARRAYQLTLDELARIEAQTPGSVRRVGSLRIACSDEERADCETQRAAMQRDGLAAERYEGPEGRGLLFPQDAVVQPLARCRTLAEQALSQGAQLFERTPALTLSGDEVETPAGRVRAGAVIVAVDGRLETLLPELAGHVRTARLQMLATAPTDEVTLERPVYARWGYEYYQQLRNGRVALGGFRDAGGDAEWDAPGAPSEVVQRRLEAYLRGELGIHAPITHRWAAPVGYTPSGIPLLTEVRPMLWALGGYSGHGNIVGSLLGRFAAQLALGERAPEAALVSQRV